MSVTIQKPSTKTSLHNALVKAYKATLPPNCGPDVEKIANEFANALDGVIADEIEKMIKAQAITITNTPTKLVSLPYGGPVTGEITITPQNVVIE